MIVMLANNTGVRTGYLAGRFPGLVGHLFSPGAQRGPYEFMPYALDNGAFAAGDDWSASDWIKLLEWAKLSGQKPLWALVPDVVGDRLRTLRKWDIYAPVAAKYGWPLAFAAQDGMTPDDVPANASVVFIGGSTEWKWANVALWCKAFQRVHVGRANTYRLLRKAQEAGAESSDGTGFMRGDQRQYRDLMAFLSETAGETIRSSQDDLELIA